MKLGYIRSRWHSIMSRCYNPKHKSYDIYGGRGVIVCDEWKEFDNFKKWFVENYIEGFEIDKDLGGGTVYSPETCRFISKADNIRESTARRDNTYSKIRTGELNPNSKDKAYYETYPVPRYTFKKACHRQGWDFDKFAEIYSGEKYANNSKRFYYKEII